MKKLLFVFLGTLLSLSALADESVKSWNFTNNEEGECIVDIVLPTEKTKEDALKAVKIAINKISLVSRDLISTTDSSMTYELIKNTKNRYNPFAGSFTENMSFKLVATASEGVVKIKCTNFSLIGTYTGYGNKVETREFTAMIDEYHYNQELIDGGTLKKKEIKKLKDDQKNINSELNMCQEELNKMIETIKIGL